MSRPLHFATEDDLESFVRRFRARLLPKAEWTHQAHLAVGLWHALAYPFEQATDELRSAIRAHNEATGVPNTADGGYHETMTRFFLHALSTYAELYQTQKSRLELFNALPQTRLRDKATILAFYTRPTVMSVAARSEWVEPDHQALSGLRQLLQPAAGVPHPFYLRRASRQDAAALLDLIVALADYEKLPPPDPEARERLIEDAFGPRPRFEPWLAIADDHPVPVAYAIFLETYSSFLARPTLYIEDIFVLPEFRGSGIGGALLRQAVEMAHARGFGRMEWTALDWNVNAQKVYEHRLGAKRMKEWFLYRMTRDDMERYLTQPSGQP